MKLQVILPAYNEATQIPVAINKLFKEFKDNSDSVQILLILNGCTDNSLEIAKKLELDFNGFLKVFEFKEKIGKGGAILKGFEESTSEMVCYSDVDCAVPPSEIKKLYQNIGRFDCIIGSRHLPKSNIYIQQSLQRRIAGKAFNLLCRKLFGFPYRDTQCGGKIFKRKTINSIIENINDKGWAFDVDLLVTLYLKGFSIKEYPINWYHDDNTKIKLVSDGWRMLFSIIKIKSSTQKPSFEKILFLQHHYINQGTFIRSINLARHIANKDNHILVTGINDKIKYITEYDSLNKNPYVTIVKLPRFFQANSTIDILLRLPFAIWITIKHKYKVLYVFALGMPTNSVPALFHRIFRGKNIIVDWDDIWFNGYGKYTGKIGNYLFYFFEIVTLKLIRPNLATTVSSFLKRKFIASGLKASQINVIGNGVDQEKESILKSKIMLKEKHNIPHQTKVLISVGNTYGKSFNNLIEAFKISSSQTDDLKLYLIGSFLKGGKIGKNIENVIKENRELFLSKVVILGHIPYEHYIEYLSLADVAILPMENTDIDKARFPIRIGDYIKYNLPIVSNATGVIEEILKKYQYGLICKVEDINQFGINILDCATNPAKYSSESKSKMILKNELDWSNHSKILKKVIDKNF